MKLTLFDEWLKAIRILKKRYKKKNRVDIDVCPLCRVAAKEEEKQDYFRSCVCPWKILEHSTEHCGDAAKKQTKQEKLDRLNRWEKMIKELKKNG